MPRSHKRGRPYETEAGLADEQIDYRNSPLVTAGERDLTRREDSSEAASDSTLSPALLTKKGSLETSTCALLYSQSAASSHGGEAPFFGLPLRDLDCQHPSQTAPLLLDMTKHSGWELANRGLDEGLANLLSSGDSDTMRHRQSMDCSISASGGTYYMRYEEFQELQPVTYETNFEGSCAEPKDFVGSQWARVLNSQSAKPFGSFWQKLLQPQPARRAKDVASIEQILTSLETILPEELRPVTTAGNSSSWLAFSSAGRAATELKLQVGSSLWVSGFTKAAPALRPVHLSILPGQATKRILRQGEIEAAHRTWVVQEDQEALVGPELVLKALRAEANINSCGQQSTAVAAAFEEVDSKAVVIGLKNELGAAAEIVQEPGQLLALQQQGHCSIASGGVFLTWNVAYGAEWPSQALQVEAVRNNSVRRAAVAAKNAWLATEQGLTPPLHVLRLLFSVACNISEAHDSLVEGLQQIFVPLCMRDIALQSECPLPQMNARKGILESRNHAGLRCSCCSGEFLFSFVCLIKRKGEKEGSLCWQCWAQREALGMQKHCRNARKCVVLQKPDLQRLVAVIGTQRAVKRQRTFA